MNKEFRLWIMTLIFALLLPINALADNASEDDRYYVYYVNNEESDLVEVEYHPEKAEMDSMIREMLQMINEGDAGTESGNKNLLPEGVHINSYEIIDSHLRIDFNEEYDSVSRGREVLLRKGIASSFLQIPGIESIEVTVDGNSLKDSKGNLVGSITRDSFLELQGNSPSAYRYELFTLYFTDETGTKLVPEYRSIYYRRSLSKERVILEQLIKGPMEEEHFPVLPHNVNVKRIGLTDGIGYVDLSSEFIDEALDISPDISLYAIVNSVIASRTVDKVQILIDGRSEVPFGEYQDLYTFFEWNQELIREE